MKYIYAVFLGLTALSNIQCHVTDRFNHVDQSDRVTTQLPEENDTGKVVAMEASEKKLESPKIPDSGRTVYLDDVLFSLKHQNWTAEEEPCLNHIYRLVYSLQNFTLWAVWDWDAQASEAQGLLFGNRYQLGNFDQCMNAPWADSHPELKTKYCLAEIVLERTDKAVRHRVENPYQPYQSALDYMEHHPPHTRPLNELTWGACVPAACAPQTVERLLSVMLARSHLGAAGMRANITINESCQSIDNKLQYDTLFYAFFGLMGSLTAIALICTFLNNRKKELNPNSLNTSLIKAFCLKENALDLLKYKAEGIEVFYGIRFLTMCLIVVDHQIGIYNAGPISDGLSSDKVVQSLLGLFIIHDDLFVDTFFLLSGFLTSSVITKIKKLPNPLFIILKRYVRLIVGFSITIFYVAAVLPYTGSGPLWNRFLNGETKQCRKNWWINMLMLHNYVDSENICIVVSWYIPCDFHAFVVTILVYSLYRSWPKLGLTIAAILGTGAILVPGIINYVYKMPAVQLFTFDFVVNPRASEEFHLTYIKSHTRYAAYIVGFLSGYLFVRFSRDGSLNKIRQKWAVLGTCAAMILMVAVMLLGSTFLGRSFHPIEGAVYAALNRPAWACSVALLVLCCTFGHVPLVKSFLSWYPWAPLSRLSYGLYLTHSIMINRNVFITRNPQHNDYHEILNLSVGVIFWGCIAALALFLLTEAPANKLLALAFKSKIKKIMTQQEKEKPAITSINTSISTIPTDSQGHLNDNLPDTIYFSSKI